MKKLILLLLLPFFSGIEVDAQAPHAFKYQTVVRDMTGNPMVNQIISFRLSIITGSPDGQVIYIEVHTDTTNLFGMATLDVGKGSAIQGVFSEIDWGASDYFLKTELDESGGSNFSTMGITEILSVPYALNAGSLTLTSPGGKNFDVFVDDDGNLMTSCTPMPTIADAGSDQLNITGSTSVILQGNTPVYGSGLWSILNGAGGSFSDPGDPGTTFYGNVGILYSLRWTITTPCDSSYDETDVSFIYQFLNCGDPFTDIRDGQTYYTVQIGPQCWMKNNLNIGTQIDGSISMTDNGIIEKYCYDNNPANCELYGGLYQWNEVMQYATDPSVQGICPPNGGWHLPSDFEWKILEGTADSQYPVGDPVWSQSGWRGYNAGQNLKSASGWNSANGNDLFGFTALPGGNLVNNIIFADIGDMAHFWTSSSGDTYNANYRYFWIYTNIHRNFSSKENGYSLRCLLDPPLFNQPPAQPSDPQPQNGAQHQPTNTVLSWSCSDPDGTALSFSVWFGLNSNPQLIATHHPDTFYTPASVLMDTTCYWRVVAYDIEGDSTSGPVWSFSTYPVVWQCGLPVLDDRDGKSYETVQIGNQCWMAENLNVGNMINISINQTDNSIIEKYCYSNVEDSCSKYGGLYQWYEMMAYSSTPGAQGICMPGWHVPTSEEWKMLEGAVDSQYNYPDPIWDQTGLRGFDAGLNLKSTYGWQMGANGTDLYGFTALAAGYKGNGYFTGAGYNTNFWTSNENFTDYGWKRFIYNNNNGISNTNYNKYFGVSLRCLKN